jgi:hypothetical protein
MWKRVFFVGLAAVVSAFAQEGHPLTGTWTGDWGSSPAQRNHITLVMSWDGNKISGVINPGPDSAEMQSVALNLTNWTVRIDADAKDATGKPIHIEAEGKIEDLGSPHRRLVGKWTQGTLTGDFKVARE